MHVGKMSEPAYRSERAVKAQQADDGFADLLDANASSRTDVARNADADVDVNSIWPNVKETSLSGASDNVRSVFEKMHSSSRPEGLSDSQWLTQLAAGLGASDYNYAKLALSERQSPERYASGEAPDILKVNYEGHVFTLAVKLLDVSSLKIVTDPSVLEGIASH